MCSSRGSSIPRIGDNFGHGPNRTDHPQTVQPPSQDLSTACSAAVWLCGDATYSILSTDGAKKSKLNACLCVLIVLSACLVGEAGAVGMPLGTAAVNGCGIEFMEWSLVRKVLDQVRV